MINNLVTAIIVSLIVLGNVSIQAQTRERTVIKPKKVGSVEPIELTGYKVGARDANPSGRIIADANWIKDLSLGFKNISRKDIVYLSVVMNIEKQGTLELPLALKFTAGTNPCTRSCGRQGPIEFEKLPPVARPRETVTLALKASTANWAYGRFQETGVDPLYGRLLYDFVVFSDGTAWSQGQEMRLDPNNDEHWVVMPPLGTGSSGGRERPKLNWTRFLANLVVNSTRSQQFGWDLFFETVPRVATTTANNLITTTESCVWRTGETFGQCGQAFFCTSQLWCTYRYDALTTTPQFTASGYQQEVEVFCDVPYPPNGGQDCQFCFDPYKKTVQQFVATGYCDDLDNDGFSEASGDCDDTCSACNPGNAFENIIGYWCGDTGDNDCDGYIDCNDSDCGADPLCAPSSPILIDTSGDGFSMTSHANGVLFDINHDGRKEKLSWTSANSNDAWLVLDRNQNGNIDDGSELFGNHTIQPAPPAGEERNGFLALREFDKPLKGGNYDGEISLADTIFNKLRLWTDTNHSGTSDPGELHPLSDMGVDRLELTYKSSKRTDSFGNQFRYRAKVRRDKGVDVGKWAWDVFLVGAQ